MKIAHKAEGTQFTLPFSFRQSVWMVFKKETVQITTCGRCEGKGITTRERHDKKYSFPALCLTCGGKGTRKCHTLTGTWVVTNGSALITEFMVDSDDIYARTGHAQHVVPLEDLFGSEEEAATAVNSRNSGVKPTYKVASVRRARK